MFYNQVNLPYSFVARIYNTLRIPYKMKDAIIHGKMGNKSMSSIKAGIQKLPEIGVQGGRFLEGGGRGQIQPYTAHKV